MQSTTLGDTAARSVEHAVDSAKAAELELTREEMAAIDTTEFDRS